MHFGTLHIIHGSQMVRHRNLLLWHWNTRLYSLTNHLISKSAEQQISGTTNRLNNKSAENDSHRPHGEDHLTGVPGEERDLPLSFEVAFLIRQEKFPDAVEIAFVLAVRVVASRTKLFCPWTIDFIEHSVQLCVYVFQQLQFNATIVDIISFMPTVYHY